MIIRELKKGITDKNFIELVKTGKIKIEKPLLLGFDTGTAWLNLVLYQGFETDDLIAIIDEIASNDEHDEVLRYYDYDDADVLESSDEFLPINGGACYTDMLYTVDEL